jgi:hypothetical protein
MLTLAAACLAGPSALAAIGEAPLRVSAVQLAQLKQNPQCTTSFTQCRAKCTQRSKRRHANCIARCEQSYFRCRERPAKAK